MTIPDIGIQSVGIDRIPAPNIHHYVPHTQTVPFILNIGSPVVDMPGCVKYHPDAADNRETPNLKEDDSNGTKVLCDGEYPTYDAMDYTPEDLQIYTETAPPPVQPPPDPPGTPDVTPPVIPEGEIECPAPNQPRVGDLSQAGDEKVIGHEIQNGQCVVLYEPTTTIEKFLPSTNQVSTTAAIAVVATAAAAATPLLLKVVKPIVKQLIKRIQKLLGKEPPRPSRIEIKANAIRQKRGLPPLKIPKKRKRSS